MLILITVVVRKADQYFTLGQVRNQTCGGRSAAPVWDGLEQS